MRSFRQRSHGLSLHERVTALKQQQRDRDEFTLRNGVLSAQEINRKNSAFGPGFAASVKLDLSKAGWAH